MRPTIIIDNGHGLDTPGKCSPDKRLLEYAWCREVAVMLHSQLIKRGYDAVLITPEVYDVPLPVRVKRINEICRERGAKNVLLVSIHVNAGSESDKNKEPDKYGSWKSACGFSVYISKNASDRSKRMAQLLTTEFENAGLMGNRFVPACKYWRWDYTDKDIYILKNSLCPAVLTENLYQDNRQDVEYLLSDEGKQTIVNLHVNAIEKYN